MNLLPCIWLKKRMFVYEVKVAVGEACDTEDDKEVVWIEVVRPAVYE